MFIRLKNGATWQVVGSDRYDAADGSFPSGYCVLRMGAFQSWLIPQAGPRERATTPRCSRNPLLMVNSRKRGRQQAHFYAARPRGIASTIPRLV
jgi:hypothetical protein